MKSAIAGMLYIISIAFMSIGTVRLIFDAINDIPVASGDIVLMGFVALFAGHVIQAN